MNTLKADIEWLEKIILYQLEIADEKLIEFVEKEGKLMPNIDSSLDNYSNLVAKLDLVNIERAILILCVAVYFKPEVFKPIIDVIKEKRKFFESVGGVLAGNNNAFIPTGETAIFLFTNGNLEQRLKILPVISPSHKLFTSGVLQFIFGEENFLPFTFSKLQISQDTYDLITTGKPNQPSFSTAFPASKVDVQLDWKDVVLSDVTLNALKDLEYWLKFETELFNNNSISYKIKKGYKVIFYGPSGTGKTLVAGLIGKKYGYDVYRIDASQLSSKYIGETEKNIANLFNQAKNKSWILFFDEGETLFSKRSNSGSNNEKYSNQQVGYLLQMIEDFPGVLILATNLKGNMDEAFIRRFQKMIYFEAPDVEYRKVLWEKAFENTMPISSDIDFNSIAKSFDLVGGQIVNVVKQALLRTKGNNLGEISKSILMDCINEEKNKK